MPIVVQVVFPDAVYEKLERAAQAQGKELDDEELQGMVGEGLDLLLERMGEAKCADVHMLSRSKGR